MERKEGTAERTQMTRPIAELRGLLYQNNEVLRSAFAIAERNGATTNWSEFRKVVKNINKITHEYLYKGGTGQNEK
jgi:hypothetical protein